MRELFVNVLVLDFNMVFGIIRVLESSLEYNIDLKDVMVVVDIVVVVVVYV